MSDHVYRSCEGQGCSGCSPSRVDCLYHVLGICRVCGAGEGGLTTGGCPGFPITADAEQAVYAGTLSLAQILAEPERYRRA